MDKLYEEKLQLSEQQKLVLGNMAKAAGLTIDDFLWQASMAFKSKEERNAIASLAQQVKQTATRISDSIDDTVAFIDASNRRIEEMETRARRGLSWAS